jgi:Domain of unknown function (DUF4331)
MRAGSTRSGPQLATTLGVSVLTPPHAGAICEVLSSCPFPPQQSHRLTGSGPGSNVARDATDLYMFRSYESGRQNFVTVLANYMPFQDPQGGPNFHIFSPEGLYEIHIDNNGDAVEDITFQFRFTNTSKATALTIGGKAAKIPLINSGVIAGVNPAALNVRETFMIDVLHNGRRAARSSVTNASGGATVFDKPVDNIGDKVFGAERCALLRRTHHARCSASHRHMRPCALRCGHEKPSFTTAPGHSPHGPRHDPPDRLQQGPRAHSCIDVAFHHHGHPGG